MIDSHCHLNFKNISDNLDEIIDNAIKNNIKSILSINTNPKDFESHFNLINKYKSIYISYGLHPLEVKSDNILSTDSINSFCKNDKVIGIGETGIDLYYSKDNIRYQYKSFENHIESSIQSKIPLIIHQRNSENEIIDILKNYQKENELSIVFHCFSGSQNLLYFCRENNYYISISGIITFKNANKLRETIKNFPINKMLLETDSPFLSPEPHRGKTNQPSYVKYIYKYLSEFYNISLEKFIDITEENFYKLFSKAYRYNKISK